MPRQKVFVFAVLSMYLILIVLFIVKNKALFHSSPCAQGSACVRFCCDDHDSCSGEFISKYFNASSVTHDIDSEEKIKVTYLFGRPDCSALKNADSKWEFLRDWLLYKEENDTGYHLYYDFDQYCLEAKSNNESGWELKYCEQHGETLHIFLIAASILVAATTLVVYVVSNSIRNSAGKSEFLLLLGILLLHCSFIWAETLEILLNSGLLLTNSWASVLILDIWRAFNYQKANLDEKRQFRLYLSVVVSTCLFFIVFYFFNIFNIAMFGGFLLMALVNVTLLLHTSLKVYRLSKSTRLSDHAWFEIEKERFWQYLGIYFILLIMLPMEVYSVSWYKTAESRIVPDVIILLSTFVISVVLACNKLLCKL